MDELPVPPLQPKLSQTAGPHVSGLGPVEDDWAAVAAWMSIVENGSDSKNGQTIATYRFHLAKFRWYCEQELGKPPSLWNRTDVEAFTEYLADLPERAISRMLSTDADAGGGRPPFRKQPSATSRSDIMRFVKAMFAVFHGTGYMQTNPTALMTFRKPQSRRHERAVADYLFDLVLQTMADKTEGSQKIEQIKQRDRFIFVCLREAGLRASELVDSKMDSFQTIYSPRSRSSYWVLSVTSENAFCGKSRKVPVTPALLNSLITYRRAFGLAGLPGDDNVPHGLILSVRTSPHSPSLNGTEVTNAAVRRALGAWRDIGTRQGLHAIIKGGIRETVARLRATGDVDAAEHLERVSAHWMRHTFALSQIVQGRDNRVVAASLGHANVNYTMTYTDQEALDQIDVWEREEPGSVALATP